MPLSSGTRLGHYEIIAPLGAGGMGEVYRAHDTRLNRDVALKVLPEALANDAERMARFEREAHVLASLNHPHIATVYGFESGAIGMELVEGPTLAERISHRAMPLEEALPIAMQIAEGLEYAHEKGVVHRDLKPANVKLTADGNVKILDFGLAKALETPVAQGNPSISPTLTLEGTRAGVILGTAAYMAPEQARGAMVDKRADIWAFGVVLYEMLTGKQPFKGPTVSDTLAAVLKTEPDWDAVPPPARPLVRRCLVKDPKLRLRDIGDARIALAEIGNAVEAPVQPAPKASLWKVAAGILAVVAAVAVWALLGSPHPTSQPLVRLAVDLPNFANPPGFVARSAILSPDGSRLVYTGRDADGQAWLYTRLLDKDQPTPLPGTDDGYAPFFAPDGQSIGFFAKRKLKRTSVMGGGTIELSAVNNGRGGSWGEDGNIIFAADLGAALSRIPASGGMVQQVTEVEKGRSHRWPQVLTEAQAVLFTHTTVSADTTTNATIEVQSLRTGERKILVRDGYFGRYLKSGHLVYMKQGTLYAAPMDIRRLVLTGPALPVVEGVASSQTTAFGQVEVSFSGVLLYAKGKTEGGGAPPQTLVWLDGAGQTRPLRQIPQQHNGLFSLSPEGHRLAMGLFDGIYSNVWVYDWKRDTTTRLTFERSDFGPVWTPDGKHIVFSSDKHGGAPNLYWMRADGASQAARLTESANQQVASSFSPDGKQLAFFENETHTQIKRHLWTLPLDDIANDHPKAGKPAPFLQTAFDEFVPVISPDGRWLAYTSDESGSFAIYVRSFPGPGGKWQVSSGSSQTQQPVWSKKAPELFYSTSEGIMVVTYHAKGDAFEFGKSRLWAAKKGLIWYDLAPDGKRFAIAEPVVVPDGKSDTHVTFLLNFFDELRRRTPAKQ